MSYTPGTRRNENFISLDHLALIRRLFPNVTDFWKLLDLPMSEPTFRRVMNGNPTSEQIEVIFDEAVEHLRIKLGEGLWVRAYTFIPTTPEQFAEAYSAHYITGAITGVEWQKVLDNWVFTIKVNKIIAKLKANFERKYGKPLKSPYHVPHG